jgi:hypothetical protein
MTDFLKEISLKYRLERFSSLAVFPNRGNVKELYLSNDTGILYQWDGASYTEINAGTASGVYNPNVIVRSNADSPYSSAANDVIICDMSLGDVTIVLPVAALNKNAIIVAKKNGSSPNDVVIDGDGAETIDGSLTQTIKTKYNSFTVICDGFEWFII